MVAEMAQVCRLRSHVPSRTITLILGAMPFLWQDRLRGSAAGHETVQWTVFPPNGTGCCHADPSSQASDDHAEGACRDQRAPRACVSFDGAVRHDGANDLQVAASRRCA
jgi:hypothetical protein